MKENANIDIKIAAMKAGVPLWKIALGIGTSYPTLARWLRVPLSDDKREQIMKAIKKLGR